MPRYRLLLILLLTASPLRADDDFWLDSRQRGPGAAAQLAGAADPWTLAALRLGAFDAEVWDEPPPVLDRVPPLSRRRLDAVRDDQPFLDYSKHAPQEIPRDILDEDAAYWQAVLYAAKVKPGAFAQAAAGNRYLTFGHLYGEPAKYRGRVVHFDGRLVLLKKLDPPPDAQRKGLRELYEAWVYLDLPGSHPLCVILPRQPEGVAVADNQNVRVSVDGYFFKRYRYISGRLDEQKNNVSLSTVLLIAPTLTVRPAPPPSSGALLGGSAWPWLLGFGAGMVTLIVGMTWWYRRGDRRVRERLRATRAAHVAEQMAALEQPAPGPGSNGVGHLP